MGAQHPAKGRKQWMTARLGGQGVQFYCIFSSLANCNLSLGLAGGVRGAAVKHNLATTDQYANAWLVGGVDHL